MPGPRGDRAELEFMTFLLRYCDANAPRDKLGEIGDGLEADPEIDAAEFRAWFEERITNRDHRNYLSPEGWTRKTGDFYDADDYAGLANERLRPVWQSIWQHVPEVDRRDFPAYGPPGEPAATPTQNLKSAQIPHPRSEGPPDPGTLGFPKRPSPRPGGSFPGQRGGGGNLPGAPGVVIPASRRRPTIPGQRGPRGRGS